MPEIQGLTTFKAPITIKETTDDSSVLLRIQDKSGNTLFAVTRTERVLNVMSYGAVGDGAADDTTPVQSALTAAATTGGTVYFPPGVYKITTTLTVGAKTKLRGAGIDVTILRAGAAIQLVSLTAGVSFQAFEDLTLDGNRSGFGSGTDAVVGGNGNCTDFRMSRVKVTNSRAFDVFLNVSSGGWTRGRVEGCIFEDTAGGYDAFGSGLLSDFVFTDCIWRNTSGQGFATTNTTGGVILQGCHFEGPMGNGISGEPASHITVSNCRFHNLNDAAIGIYLRAINSGTADPNSCVITNNDFYNTGSVGGLLMDSAIIILNGSYCTVTGNTIYRMGRHGMILQSQTVTGSANTCRNNVVNGNVIVDSNQDNVASIPAVYLNQVAGTMTDNQVTANNLSKVGGDSNMTHGILESGTVDNSLYQGNNLRGALTAGIGFGSATTQIVKNNLGFNPQGAAAISVTASPFTYTNNDRVPEAVYIRGGTVSDISKNSVTLFTATGATVWVEPGESFVTTYSAAPTMVKDRK